MPAIEPWYTGMNVYTITVVDKESLLCKNPEVRMAKTRDRVEYAIRSWDNRYLYRVAGSRPAGAEDRNKYIIITNPTPDELGGV